MPQTRPPSQLPQELVLTDLERDLVADAIKRYDLDPDATTEMP